MGISAENSVDTVYIQHYLSACPALQTLLHVLIVLERLPLAALPWQKGSATLYRSYWDSCLKWQMLRTNAKSDLFWVYLCKSVCMEKLHLVGQLACETPELWPEAAGLCQLHPSGNSTSTVPLHIGTKRIVPPGRERCYRATAGACCLIGADTST